MANEITAICISTTNAKCLPVMLKSIEQYVPSYVEIYIAFTTLSHMDFHSRNHSMHLMQSSASNFGDAYNLVMKRAFETHSDVIIANDDIVFNPNTFDLLQKDWDISMEYDDDKMGYLGCRSNYARGVQNIRWRNQDSKSNGLSYDHERAIIETDIIAPICAAIHRNAWIDLLPINLFSDDVQCLMMAKQKKMHFVSRAYVHHVGSQTVEYKESEYNLSMDYLQKNYIEYYHYLKA